MAVHLFTHPACLAHETPQGHPERTARLRAVLDRLDDPAFAGLVRHEARAATRADLERVHTAEHVDAVLDAAPASGFAMLDGDTFMSPGSVEAALRAAGALLDAVDTVVGEPGARAFCAVRPPGHHAEPARAMGFCLFDSIAVGAAYARAVHGLARVAIVDFDVHHGNGTQAIFWSEPAVLFASTHQMPLFPGTGRREERGASGTVVNAPLPPGAGGAELRAAMSGIVLPAVEAFGPDLLMISAGFDAHRADPLAGLNLVEDDFAWVTRELVALAGRRCDGRVVSTLEGGYDLDALAESAAAHVTALMETT